MERQEMTPEQQLAFDGFIDIMVQMMLMISCRISGRKSSSRASFRRSSYTRNSRKMGRF